MSRIHLFMNNPTAGDTDGTEISSGTETLPLTFTLDAANSETAIAKCAVRCDAGYSLTGGADISAVGGDTSKWKLAADDDFADTDSALAMALWQDSINVASVDDTNSIFWVKVETTGNEEPQNDRSVDIVATGVVAAKEV